MLFFTKKEEESPKGFVANEEIDSQKTSKLGYFFLLLMVIFGVWQGQGLLDAIQNEIDQPIANSPCTYNLSSYLDSKKSSEINYNYYDHNYYGYDIKNISDCKFSDREKIAGIPGLYKEVHPDLVTLKALEQDLSDIRNQKNNAGYKRSQTVDEYSVSLLESIARKNQILDSDSLQGSIKTFDQLITSLSITENNLQNKINSIKNKIKQEVLQYEDSFKEVEDQYTYDKRVYELKQFLLSLLFILPVFLFAWRKYSSSKNRRSEYAVIWSGVVAISALILTQVLLVFIYRIIPHQLLQKIFEFLKLFEFFFIFIYWLGFILVPLFFGTLIYFIQKKYYNQKAVIARAFKANKCPTCSMSVAPHMVFCPICAATLKIKCASCGNYSPKAGNFCEICGIQKQIS
ncbi:MAG: zinc ribbon domain-containing protein [Patescibacteria group bacterium]